MKAGRRRKGHNPHMVKSPPCGGATNRRFGWAVVLVAVMLAGWPGALRAAKDPALPDAPTLLRSCIAALPDIPLLVTGELQSRPKDGEIEKRVRVEMLLDWQATPPQARYTIRDAFGKARDHLSITWHDGQDVEYRYFKGDPLESAPLPILSEPIEGTDISWMDLSLSFLWWPHARTVGGDEVRGRDCLVLDVPAPGADYAGIAGVRLWIDPKIPVMLRAVSYGLDGLATREVEVKAFKKINDRWVIQVIEVESQPSGHKTILRVRDVQDRNRKSFIKVDEGGPEAPADEGKDESVEPVTPVLLNDEGGVMEVEGRVTSDQ